MNVKEWFLKFFTDDKGNPSTMRLIFVIFALTAIAMGWVVLIVTMDVNSTILITSVLMTNAIGLKFGGDATEKYRQKDLNNGDKEV